MSSTPRARKCAAPPSLPAAWLTLVLALLLMVPAGAEDPLPAATLYEHADFRGRSEAVFSDDPSLRDNPIGNDQVSSVRLRPGCRLTLYQHDDYRGRDTELLEDQASLKGTRVGNDEASSFRLRCETPDPAGVSEAAAASSADSQVTQDAPDAVRSCDELATRLEACEAYECEVVSRLTGEKATRKILGRKDDWCHYVEEQTDTHTIECRLTGTERYYIARYYAHRLSPDSEEDGNAAVGREQLGKALADETVCRFMEGELAEASEDRVRTAKVARTIWDMQRVGRALMLWMTDQVLEGRAEMPPEARGEGRRPVWRVGSTTAETSYSVIPRERITRLVVPDYLRSVPEKDAWGHPYQFAVNDDFLARNVVAIRSPGRDGRFDTDRYLRDDDRFGTDPVRKSFEDDDRDILWADGFVNPQDYPLSFGGPAVSDDETPCHDLGRKLQACEVYECEMFFERIRVLGKEREECIYAVEGGSPLGMECRLSESTREILAGHRLLQSFALSKVAFKGPSAVGMFLPEPVAEDVKPTYTAFLPENGKMRRFVKENAEVLAMVEARECAMAGVSAAAAETAAEMQEIGNAMMSWLTDQVAGSEKLSLAGGSPDGSWRVDGKSYRWISYQRLTELLVPEATFFYIQGVPEKDRWGHPYQFAINENLLASEVLGIRSPGRDGRFDTDDYSLVEGHGHPEGYLPSRVGDEDRDLVWADGYFLVTAGAGEDHDPLSY